MSAQPIFAGHDQPMYGHRPPQHPQECPAADSAVCQPTPTLPESTGLTELQRLKAIELGRSLTERFTAKGDLAKAIHALSLTRALSTRSQQ